MNFLREVEVGFHLAPADKAGKALAAALDPAGEFAVDGGIFRVGFDFAEQGGAGEVAGADVEGKGEKCVELMLADREAVGHTASVVEPQGVVQMVFEDGDIFLQQLVRLLFGDGHSSYTPAVWPQPMVQMPAGHLYACRRHPSKVWMRTYADFDAFITVVQNKDSRLT